MTLSMHGTDGARVQTKDVVKYGLHEINIRAAAGAGPVSTFYVSSRLTLRSWQSLWGSLLQWAGVPARGAVVHAPGARYMRVRTRSLLQPITRGGHTRYVKS